MDTIFDDFKSFYDTFRSRFRGYKECEEFFNYLRPFAKCNDIPDYWEACIQCCFDLLGMTPKEAKMKFEDEIRRIIFDARVKVYGGPLFNCLKDKDLDGAVAILVEAVHITEEQVRSHLTKELIADIHADEDIKVICDDLLYPGLTF